jgi:RNA polymerase sigma-70 factor, ECF subfamily
MIAGGDPAPRNGERKTLGDLLYGDKPRVVVFEKDWVRLMQSIATGDATALLALYEHSHRLVYTLAVRITNSRILAEEVTVDVFHDVWQRAASYDAAGGSVVGWIMNAARARAIGRLRDEQPSERVDAGGPAETLDVSAQGPLLREALAVLTPAERQAIETAFFSELTYPEVAERLDQPLGTVKGHVRSGLEKLRQALWGLKRQ